MSKQLLDKHKRIEMACDMILKQCKLYDDFESFERAMMRLYKKNRNHELIKLIEMLNHAINNNIVTIPELRISELRISKFSNQMSSISEDAARESIRRYEDYKKHQEERQVANNQFVKQSKKDTDDADDVKD